MDKLRVKNFVKGAGWAYTGNLPEPPKGWRVGKLVFPLWSRLARRERIRLQGCIKGLENFPGDRIGPVECFHSSGQPLCKFIGTKESVCIRKEFNSQRNWFGTPTWPPFHCFGTPIWPLWLHVKSGLRGSTQSSSWLNRHATAFTRMTKEIESGFND